MAKMVPALADAVEARRQELGLTVTGLAKASGLTRQGLQPVLRGEHRNYRDGLKWSLCDALGWSRDSIDRLLTGLDPVDVTDPPTRSELDRLRALVVPLARAVRMLMLEAIERHENGEPWRETVAELEELLSGP